MKAFYDHHGHGIRASYRCFNRIILLNRLIQPFQQPERVVDFLQLLPAAAFSHPQVLNAIADQFSNREEAVRKVERTDPGRTRSTPRLFSRAVLQESKFGSGNGHPEAR
jgi:hypothetical protein